MLSHWALSSIGFITIGDLADKLSLNLISTTSNSFLLFLKWLFLCFLQLLNPLRKLSFLLKCSIQLCIEYSIGKVEFIDLFEIEMDCILKIAIKFRYIDWLSFSKLFFVPLGISFVFAFLSCEEDGTKLLFLHLLLF